MLKIGRIDVPLNFFTRLKRNCMAACAEEILARVRHQLPENLCEKLDTLSADPYPQSLHYLSALIRIQTEDYIRTDVDIECSEEFSQILLAASRKAEEAVYAMLPAGTMADRTLIDAISDVISPDILYR